MATTTQFEFRGITFTVKRLDENGAIVYRDSAHMGGPWSNAAKSAVCTSLHATFRRRLRVAMGRI